MSLHLVATFPETSAANEVGPAAASASASVGSEAKGLQRPLPDGSLTVVAQRPLKWLPVLDGEPESGDPLRLLV